MVFYSPQRGSPEYYPEEEIGRPDETSEVEQHFLPPTSPGGLSEKGPRREDLQRLPKTVLLRIAIELDPDAVSESYREGWTKDDILRVIERHLRDALGRQDIEGWPYIREVEVLESSIEEEE